MPGVEAAEQRPGEQRFPAAPEHHGRERGDEDHVGVLRQEEHGEGHARVLDMEAGDDL